MPIVQDIDQEIKDNKLLITSPVGEKVFIRKKSGKFLIQFNGKNVLKMTVEGAAMFLKEKMAYGNLKQIETAIRKLR